MSIVHCQLSIKFQFSVPRSDTERRRAKTTTHILRTTWLPALRANSNLLHCCVNLISVLYDRRASDTGMDHRPLSTPFYHTPGGGGKQKKQFPRFPRGKPGRKLTRWYFGRGRSRKPPGAYRSIRWLSRHPYTARGWNRGYPPGTGPGSRGAAG